MNATETAPKSQAQITKALREAVATNKTIKDICLVFALRERTRFQVNVGPLRLTMAQEGYPMSVKEIEDALVFFASIGIGKLYYDSNKRLKGLAEIRWTLQSIGKAALGETAAVVKSHQQRKYAVLPSPDMPSNLREAAVPAPIKATAPPTDRHQVYLTATIGGRPIKFPLPMLLTSDELVKLIAELNEAGGVLPKQNGGN